MITFQYSDFTYYCKPTFNQLTAGSKIYVLFDCDKYDVTVKSIKNVDGKSFVNYIDENGFEGNLTLPSYNYSVEIDEHYFSTSPF